MADERTPIDQLLDLVVYAPFGLAVTVREELPQLVEKGRARLTGQVAMARMMGQFAVQMGQKEAERRVRDAVDRFGDVLPTGRPPSPSPSPTTTGLRADADDAAPSAPGTEAAAADRPGSAPGPADRPPSDGLPIHGYDSLSASQVVQRLAGLTPDELAAVEAYERATRGRRTILSRAAQLHAG